MSELPTAPARPKMFRPELYDARISEKKFHGPHTLELSFELVDRPMFQWHAGQYLSIVLPGGDPKRDVRPYSMWNHASEGRPGPTTILRLVSGGIASTWLHSAPVGEPVRFLAPLGVFFLREPLPKHLYFVGTGTGLVPLRAMIKELWHRGAHADRHVHLTFGVRTEDDLFYTEEFEALGAAHPAQFHFTPTLSKPGEGWSKARGRVTDHFRQVDLPVNDMQVYMCGNGAMVEEMSALLRSRGVPPSMILKEKYFDAVPA